MADQTKPSRVRRALRPAVRLAFKALAAWRSKAAQLAPLFLTASSQNEFGKRRYASGDLVGAERSFTGASKRGSVPALYNLAMLHSVQNRTDKAIDLYRRAAALDPDYMKANDLRLVPTYVGIETIRACNAACVMCPLETSPTPNRVMSDERFEKIVADILQMKPLPVVDVHGLGEPLMDKKIVKRIKYLRERGIDRVMFTSNAALMTKDWAEAVIDAGVFDVYFSIESIDKETFEKIRVGLHVEDVIQGIINFIEVRNAKGSTIPVHLVFTYSEWNREQFPAFEAFWRKHLKQGQDAIFLGPIHSFGKFAVYSNDTLLAPCDQMFSSMHIRADGNASLCCIDVDAEYKIGDTKTETLLDIFNGAQVRADRHKHLMGRRHEMKLCGECDQPEAGRKNMQHYMTDPVPQLDAERKFFVPAVISAP